MKYAYSITETFSNQGVLIDKTVTMYLINFYKIKSIFNQINYSYLPYYTQEITKLINNQRQEEVLITIDPELDLPSDTIIVTKAWTFHPDEPEKKLETTELLEFLHIMIKELQIDSDTTFPLDRMDKKNPEYWVPRSLQTLIKKMKTMKMKKYSHLFEL